MTVYLWIRRNSIPYGCVYRNSKRYKF